MVCERERNRALQWRARVRFDDYGRLSNYTAIKMILYLHVRIEMLRGMKNDFDA